LDPAGGGISGEAATGFHRASNQPGPTSAHGIADACPSTPRASGGAAVVVVVELPGVTELARVDDVDCEEHAAAIARTMTSSGTRTGAFSQDLRLQDWCQRRFD
jgi:hypothetical protein